MLVIPALAFLFLYVYWRPHQVFDGLSNLTINLPLGMVLFAMLLDLRIETARLRGSPLLALVAAFIGWCLLTLAISAPAQMSEHLPRLIVALIVFIAVSEGLQSMRALGAIAGLVFFFSVALSALGVHQGLAPQTCFIRGTNIGSHYDGSNEKSDGRPCTTPLECYEGGQPGVNYLCEHVGLFGTHSIRGRIRYRGILEDPNELSWVVSMGIPFAFARWEQKRTRRRLLMMIAAIGLGGVCMIMTQSRSGQIGMLATFAVYFIRRFGVKGALAAAAVGLPLYLLGGRSDKAADESTEERLACWSEALTMWREHPFTGVGAGQFTEHYYATAHHSYMLTLAELGPIGLLLWSAGIYFAFKVTLRAQVDLAKQPEATVARTWALALFASLVGLVIPSFFLTLTYHPVLWIYLGLVGALYGAIRKHEPTFHVPFGWRDLGLVAAIDVAIVVGTSVYTRIKGF